jgi:hypothetical protein
VKKKSLKERDKGLDMKKGRRLAGIGAGGENEG